MTDAKTINADGEPRDPANDIQRRRTPILVQWLLAILLGALVAGGTSYSLRLLNY